MREAEYAAARAAVLAGDDPLPALLEDCRRSVRLLIHSAGLPAHYSPDGVWSPEAIEEVYADWVAVRLVGRGQLRAMLQRAPVLRVFRRMAETSVRQHLIDGLAARCTTPRRCARSTLPDPKRVVWYGFDPAASRVL